LQLLLSQRTSTIRAIFIRQLCIPLAIGTFPANLIPAARTEEGLRRQADSAFGALSLVQANLDNSFFGKESSLQDIYRRDENAGSDEASKNFW